MILLYFCEFFDTNQPKTPRLSCLIYCRRSDISVWCIPPTAVYIYFILQYISVPSNTPETQLTKVTICTSTDRQVRLVYLQADNFRGVGSLTKGQILNFHWHSKQTENCIGKIGRGYCFPFYAVYSTSPIPPLILLLVSLFLSRYLSLVPLLFLSRFLSVCLSLFLSISVYLYFSIFNYLYLSFFLYLSPSLLLFVSISVCLSLKFLIVNRK
jgi:hypothetical protein